MQIKTIVGLLIALFVHGALLGQNISGQVKNSKGEPIPFVSILLKANKTSSPILAFSRTDAKGRFSLTFSKKLLDNKKDSLLLKAQIFGYTSSVQHVPLKAEKEAYTVHFVLFKQAMQHLKKVVITGEIPKFSVSKNKDTVTYNVGRYLDQTDVKIEDVIKKLPGIEVNENSGEIFYKGKSVETVTLDGDNLFNYNYMLGTQNINVDMVTQIQAIKNYTKNPLLHGIKQSGKVALNLKLKEKKVHLSGSITAGLGFFDNHELARNAKANLLRISEQQKSFAILTHNNTGVNHTPFHYFGAKHSVEQKKERNYLATRNMYRPLFSNGLPYSRVNDNNQYFGNYRVLFEPDSRLNIKASVYFLKDRITSRQLFKNNYHIAQDNFSTSDRVKHIKKPTLYRGDLTLKYNLSKTSLLEYDLRVQQENTENSISTLKNETEVFQNLLNTNDFYVKQHLQWTKKLSSREALQASFFHSYNKAPQTLYIAPGVTDSLVDQNVQKSQFNKRFLEGKVTYLGSNAWTSYTFSIGGRLLHSPFQSILLEDKNKRAENNFGYTKKMLFSTGSYGIKFGQWHISPSFALLLLNQTLQQDLKQQTEVQQDFIFEPSLSIGYDITHSSMLNLSAGYTENTNAERFLFLNRVLIDNRTTIENTPSLRLRKSQNYNLSYTNYNMYDLFEIKANIGYQKSTGNFFTNSTITENTIHIKYFNLPQDNSSWNFLLKGSKYIPFMTSTIKLTNNYLVSNFKNVVNQSGLRQNQLRSLNNSLYWKTAWDFSLNFQNTLSRYKTEIRSNRQSVYTNISWSNKSKLIFTPSKKWVVTLSADYHLPSIHPKEEDYYFVNVNVRHQPANGNWTLSFHLRNLTNEKNFENIQTTDIATSIFRSRLLPRSAMFSLTWFF